MTFTPPNELVDAWEDKYTGHMPEWVLRHVAAEAAQWGADQELDACCGWLDKGGYFIVSAGALRRVRRPNLPSLKEQALEELQRIEANIPQNIKSFEASCETIRTALEALNDN